MYKFLARPVGPSLPLISPLHQANQDCFTMAAKKADSKTVQTKVGGSKSSTATKTGLDTQSSSPTTRSKAKATAETLAQASLLPKSTPIFGSDLPKTSTTSSSLLGNKEEIATLGAKDAAITMEEAFSKSSVSQKSASKS